MATTWYGFGAGWKIDALAERLESVCWTVLYRANSPMIGPWCTSTGLQGRIEQHLGELNPSDVDPKSGKHNSAPSYHLELNDPDPYYGGPTFNVDGCVWILRIDAPEPGLAAIRRRLLASDLDVIDLPDRSQPTCDA